MRNGKKCIAFSLVAILLLGGCRADGEWLIAGEGKQTVIEDCPGSLVMTSNDKRR